MGVAIMQACVWGRKNQELQELFYLSLTIHCYLRCAQLLGSLIASFQTCAICIISGFTCVKHWEKAWCQMPLSWISDWRGYTSEVLQGILRLTGELMAFNTLLHFFGMWACLWVREMDTGKSWGHLIVVLLIWNQSLAAVRCKVCCSPHTDTVRGVLQACWILGITAESSAPRATDHAACPLREWDSTALLPASLRLCWSFSGFRGLPTPFM